MAIQIVQLVARLTKDIVETYQICNSQFKYSEELNPKRYLTSPSTGVLNDGYDNVNSDLILIVNYVLVNPDTQRRLVLSFISNLCSLINYVSSNFMYFYFIFASFVCCINGTQAFLYEVKYLDHICSSLKYSFSAEFLICLIKVK